MQEPAIGGTGEWGAARSRLAEREVSQLTDREMLETLHLICKSRPEAVLASINDLRRHQAVVASLRLTSPPADPLPFG